MSDSEWQWESKVRVITQTPTIVKSQREGEGADTYDQF